jgi:hypothetical protein
LRAAIDEKSLVNESAEMLGAGVLLAVLVVAGGVLAAELVVVVELDELPHAVTAKLALTARAARTGLLFSKNNWTSILSTGQPPGCVRAPTGDRHGFSLRRNPRIGAMNEALTSPLRS